MDLQVRISSFAAWISDKIKLPSFDANQKRILAIASLALGLLAACFFIYRWRSNATSQAVEKKSIVPHDSVLATSSSVQSIPAVHEISPIKSTEAAIATEAQQASSVDKLTVSVEGQGKENSQIPKETLCAEIGPASTSHVEATIPLKVDSQELAESHVNGNTPAPPSLTFTWDGQPIRTASEKEDIIQAFKAFSFEGKRRINSYSELAKEEIKEILERGDDDGERTQVVEFFNEFVRNEGNFKVKLEEIGSYQEAFSKLVTEPDALAKIAPNFQVFHARRLNTLLLQFNQVLKVVAPFYVKIQTLTIQEFPEFAQIFLDTDFTPMLNAVSTHKQLLDLISEYDKIEKNMIIKIFRELKKQSKGKRKYSLEDIDGPIVCVVQRIARYPMTLNALLKRIKPESALYEIVKLCHLYASTWCRAVNQWEG